MKPMYVKMLFAILLMSAQISLASTTANYFRVWQGFKKANLSEYSFMNELPSFMDETVALYDGHQALNNYIVVIPPKDKPSYIPEELALVGLTSEEQYREIRQTPEGQAYSARHWDVFDKNTSSSAKTFVNYTKESPRFLINNAAYDMFGKSIDWASGYTTVYIGLRKSDSTSAEFLDNLKNHIELTKSVMGPKGLIGYILIANEQYEVAFMNWESKRAYDRAGTQPDSQAVFEDAARFMDSLMFEEAQTYSSHTRVENNQAYSTMNN